MFIAVLSPMREFLAAPAAADLAVTARVKLAYKRAVRDKYARGRVGRNSKLATAQGLFGFIYFPLARRVFDLLLFN